MRVVAFLANIEASFSLGVGGGISDRGAVSAGRRSLSNGPARRKKEPDGRHLVS